MPIEERTIGARKIHPKHLLVDKPGATIETGQAVIPAQDRECWIVDLYSATALTNPSGNISIDGVTTSAGMTVLDGAGYLWVTSSTAWTGYPQQPTPGDLASISRGNKYGGQTLFVDNDFVRNANASIADFYSLPDPVPNVPDNTARLVPNTWLVSDESVTNVPCWTLYATQSGSIYQVSAMVQIVTTSIVASTWVFLDIYRNNAFYSRLDARIMVPETPASMLLLNGSQLVHGNGDFDIRLWSVATIPINTPTGYQKLMRITAHRMR
jgi:hypothetical protein